MKRFGLIDNKTMRKEALALFEKLNLKIELNELASNLSVGMQQMLEISKALMQDAKIIIMDEPTAALTNSEITVLFEQINKLKVKAYHLCISRTEWKKFLSCQTVSLSCEMAVQY